MLSGAWGAGKTYFWKNEIEEKLTNKLANNKKSCVYVSLYGKESIDTIKDEIIFKAYESIKQENEQIDWLCTQALHRMSVASVKEIKDFWGTLSIKEVNTWIKNNKANLFEVECEDNEGKQIKSFSLLDIEKRLSSLKNSNSKIQIINPFDPAIRDRKRLKKIFDFEYKIEIFVPKEKRIWGYYVYPLLQGNAFIGRIELKADRKAKQLNVLNFWKEDGVIWDAKQQEKLEKELASFALLVDIKNVSWLI